MIEFKVVKKSKKSRARLGVLKTPHGEVETPTLAPVATKAAIKSLKSEDIFLTKTQILIANTFHLHLRPGEKIIQKAGGLHNFMSWEKPLMTDSGGFQVFSLGFGSDFDVGKIRKKAADLTQKNIITSATQPKKIKITSEGVWFTSPLEGDQLFLGPKESVKIQEALGADIIFAFDECTSPLADYDYVKKAMARTHRWAEICLKVKKSNQAIFGIVQGSRFKSLREESAKFINRLGFDGFGIGGDLGDVAYEKRTMMNIIEWVLPHLDEKKPRHLLGIGYLEDIEKIIKAGIDLFDCTVPTQYARRGIAFISSGKIDLTKSRFLSDQDPIDKKCTCLVCQNYHRSYISHLFRASELSAFQLLTIHNLYFFNNFLETIRTKIKNNDL